MKFRPLFLAATIAISNAGCLMVPIPTAVSDPEPFNKNTLSTIYIGTTTRDDVREIFSNWSFKTDAGNQIAHLEPDSLEGGRWWVYTLDREMGAMGACLLVVGGQLFCSAGQPPDLRTYYLLIEFDGADKVSELSMLYEGQSCTGSEICYRNGYALMPASGDVRDDSRFTESDSEQCKLYVYTQGKLPSPLDILLVGQQTQQLSLPETFVYWTVAPGKYEFQFDNSGRTTVACGAGQNHVFEYRQGQRKMRSLDPSTGKRKINRRYLLSRALFLLGGNRPES